MAERWKAIKGYEGLYEVSDHGRVRSSVVSVSRLRKLTKAGNYWYLPLRKAGKVPKNHYIHRLVAEAFVAGNGEVVRHKDDNTSNNHYKNLIWGSHQDNVKDKVRKGRQRKGSGISSSKLCEVTALQALHLCASGKTDAEVAEYFGVSRPAITYLRQRRTWKHVVFTEAPD